MKTLVKGAVSAAAGLLAFGVLLFVPAGTVAYWQAWVFLAVFALATWIPSVYLARTNPAALERRLRGGPQAETRPVQKLVIVFVYLAVPATFVLSALDHRFGWSTVPVPAVVAGDVLVAAGLGIAMLVVIQNGYAAASVTVETGQRVVDTGLYGLVRHPMYSGVVLMMTGVPLALDSYWGLLVVPSVAVLVVRILDEEKMLTAELPGYREYLQRVRYRLAPRLW